MNSVTAVLRSAKRMIDDLAALEWPDMYATYKVEEAMLRVNVAAVADVLQQIGDVLKLVDAAPDLERIRKWANSPETASEHTEQWACGYEAARTWVRDVGLSAQPSERTAGEVAELIKFWQAEVPDLKTGSMYIEKINRTITALSDLQAKGFVSMPVEPTSCGRCDYEESDGSLIQQCKKCKAIDAAQAALAADGGAK